MAEDSARSGHSEASRPATMPRLSRRRLALAFLVAAVSDIVSYGTAFAPPVQWMVDFLTALLLFGLLGWRWAILPGLVAEAIPGVAVFPVWLLVVASVALWGDLQRSGPFSRP